MAKTHILSFMASTLFTRFLRDFSILYYLLFVYLSGVLTIYTVLPIVYLRGVLTIYTVLPIVFLNGVLTIYTVLPIVCISEGRADRKFAAITHS